MIAMQLGIGDGSPGSHSLPRWWKTIVARDTYLDTSLNGTVARAGGDYDETICGSAQDFRAFSIFMPSCRPLKHATPCQYHPCQ